MKLVKSLLLGSAAGLLAVASSQAADLPYRKAAPIEYVKICDAHGVGFFYIPGTDTCLRVGGQVRFEYMFQNVRTSKTRTGAITTLSKQKGTTGSFARARLQLDARNTTAWGTLRAFVSVDVNHKTGNFGVNGDNVDIDKAFVQWAGFTAGRVQSVFDFYADLLPFEAVLRDSDQDANVLAYTATFGGGFTGTLSIEDHNDRVTNLNQAGGTSAFGGRTPLTGGHANTSTPFSLGPYGVSPLYGTASDNGYRAPDVVGQLNLTQGWGMVQLSGAAHEERSRFTGAGAPGNLGFVRAPGTPLVSGFFPASVIGIPTKDVDTWGFGVLGGVEFNLPMLAAGDQLWLAGQYSHGALGYILNGSRYFGGTNLLNGFTGANYQDYDGVWVPSKTTGPGITMSFKQPDAYSAMASFQHYFTPTIRGAVFGSWIDVRYPGGVASTSTAFSDEQRVTTNWNEYRIGGQLVYSPVKAFDIGIEAMYSRLHQSLPSTAAVAFGGRRVPTTTGKNEDGFEGTVHVERDF